MRSTFSVSSARAIVAGPDWEGLPAQIRRGHTESSALALYTEVETCRARPLHGSDTTRPSLMFYVATRHQSQSSRRRCELRLSTSSLFTAPPSYICHECLILSRAFG